MQVVSAWKYYYLYLFIILAPLCVDSVTYDDKGPLQSKAAMINDGGRADEFLLM